MKYTIYSPLVLLTGLLLGGCQSPRESAVEPVRYSHDRISAMTTETCGAQLDEAALIAAGWQKTFEDEFNGGLSKWNIWTGGAYNNELQFYQAANLTTANGILAIEARRENVVGRTLPTNPELSAFKFTSGRIECKTNVSASRATPKVRMSARLKLPPGFGLWPAFWAYGDPWPTQGEIDIMENRSNEPYEYSTNYFYGRKSGQVWSGDFSSVITSSTSLTECWHVFEVIWTKNSLTYLLDGQVVDTKTGGYISNLFGKTERITLNLAVGGNFFGQPNPSAESIIPGTMLVDWVKVFTMK